MKYDIYLSYSGRRSYLDCPKKYKLKYIDKVSIKTDPSNSLFGSMIGKVFEWFYNEKLWTHKDVVSVCTKKIPDVIEFVCKKEKFDINSNYNFLKSLEHDLYSFVPTGIDILRKNSLLSQNSVAEVNLTTIVKHDGITLKLGGYSDFIHNFSSNNSWILDGKASKYKDKYVDPDQLILYALQHYLKFEFAPNRLGFIFWKFPEDPIGWIDYDEENLRKCLKDTIIISKSILSGKFDLKVGSHCKFCNYLSLCKDGTDHVNLLKSESKNKIIDDPDLILM